MSNHEHTPGPFSVEVPPSSSGYGRSIYALREDGPDVFVAYVGNWKQNPGTEVADATMMAASPDMLNVLSKFQEWFGENLDDPDEPLNGGDAVDDLCKLWPEIKAAIAKAKGVPQ